ncbi:MAG: DUF3048 domain-containing protein [Clostridia bacterium]|nr:DUF3048 domain-containing protein [Clostridia bacterium]
MDWFKGRLVIIILLLLGLAAGVGSFLFIEKLLKPHQEVAEEQDPPEQGQQNEPPVLVEIIQDEKWLELPRNKNLVVIIDNDVNARPQAGLEEADIVYELPIEGGTTRFMAVFSRFEPSLIGPVRSARDYNIDIAKEYDPIFVHAGGSPQAFARFSEISSLNGLEGGVDRAFWRSNEREAPFNLYSDAQTLRRVARQEGLPGEGRLWDFNYLSPIEEFSDGECKKITINYRNSNYRAQYLYDEKTKKYLRFTGGVKHTVERGKQIAVKNIIVQMVKNSVIDSEGRLELALTGRGKAVYFSEGGFKQGYWEKTADDITRYYLGEGEEVALKEGNTWISVVPLDVQVEY